MRKLKRAARRVLRRLSERPAEVRRATLAEGVILPAGSVLSPRTVVGRHTKFNGPVVIQGRGEVEFGNFCAVGSNLTVVTTNHDMRRVNLQFELHRQLGLDPHEEPVPVRIGHNVWIGEGVTIVPGATIGTGCAIGAGAVVVGNLPPFSIAVGVPARVLRQRCDDEQVAALLDIRWWEWSMDRLGRNAALLDADLSAVQAADLRSLVKP